MRTTTATSSSSSTRGSPSHATRRLASTSLRSTPTAASGSLVIGSRLDVEVEHRLEARCREVLVEVGHAALAQELVVDDRAARELEALGRDDLVRGVGHD